MSLRSRGADVRPVDLHEDGIDVAGVEALIASDFAPLQGFVLTMAVMYVALNLLIDVLYGVIDPRVRIEA